MSSAGNCGEAEYPFDKQTVFNALLAAIPRVQGMSVQSSDQLSGRIVAKAGMSLLSWGENIPIQLREPSPNKTVVQVASSAKTGVTGGGFMDDDGFLVTGNLDFGKNRKNVEKILAELSSELSTYAPPVELAKKKCPFCAELIQPEAIKCRFCGSDLRVNPAPVFEPPPVPEPLPVAENYTVEVPCPFCSKGIRADILKVGENRCPHCLQVFNAE